MQRGSWKRLWQAQNLIEVDARNGREGRAFAGRIDGEAGVVGGRIDLVDEGVGRLDVGDAGKSQFLRQPVLQRPKRPPGTALPALKNAFDYRS